mmetsp:Transcript_7899/g.32538  ORF Transcript_7899/g.32538 Transcript_7899/m.32538 type:complete len:240 (+) Transcript_7899:893-1612(+)
MPTESSTSPIRTGPDLSGKVQTGRMVPSTSSRVPPSSSRSRSCRSASTRWTTTKPPDSWRSAATFEGTRRTLTSRCFASCTTERARPDAPRRRPSRPSPKGASARWAGSGATWSTASASVNASKHPTALTVSGVRARSRTCSCARRRMVTATRCRWTSRTARGSPSKPSATTTTTIGTAPAPAALPPAAGAAGARGDAPGSTRGSSSVVRLPSPSRPTRRRRRPTARASQFAETRNSSS